MTTAPHKKPLFKSRPGVSALIAMMMVLAFMFTMSSVMVAMSRSLTIARGGRAADQAYLNAITGLELGLYKQNKPDTFNQLASAIDSKYSSANSNSPVTIAEGSTVSFNVTDDIAGGGKVCADKSVTDINQCASDKLYFVYPFPGTGTLGSSSCNAKSPPQVMDEQWYRDAYFYLKGTAYTGKQDLSPNTKSSNGNVTPIPVTNITGTAKKDYTDANIVWYIQTKLEPLDHPCLWNKLEPGSAAEIPLSNTPDDLKNLSDLWLRVRLPCRDGILCSTTPAGTDTKAERMNLFIPPQDLKSGAAAITRALLWEIVSNCKKGNEDPKLCYLRDVKSDDIAAITGKSNASKQNSLIHLNLLQGTYAQNPYSAQQVSNIMWGMNKNIYAQSSDPNPTNLYTKIADFLQGKGIWAGQSLIKPAMHLSIATDLHTGTGKELIPSIEFQVLYRTTQASKPIISNPTVISTGQNGGYTINLESSLTKQIGTYGYALIGK